jgi:hypothetical protein
MTGGFSNLGSTTGFDFSGGSTKLPLAGSVTALVFVWALTRKAKTQIRSADRQTPVILMERALLEQSVFPQGTKETRISLNPKDVFYGQGVNAGAGRFSPHPS